MKHTMHNFVPVLALLFTLGAGTLHAEAPSQPASVEPPPPHAMHGRHHGPPDAAAMTRHMQEDLGLSDAQVARVRTLNEEHIARMEKLRPSEEEMRARREEMEKIRNEHDAALQKVLSPEQYAKFRKSREEHEERRHERQNGPHPE